MNNLYDYKVKTKKSSGSAYTFVFEPETETKITSFTPGQHIMLGLYNNERNISNQRPFTICNTPNEAGTLELCIKIYQGFTKQIEQLQIGNKVAISEPIGNLKFNINHKQAVFIAGGSGITPFISILRDLAIQRATNQITIIYSAKNINDLMYYDELKKYHTIFTLTDQPSPDWSGETKRIDLELIQKYCNPINKKFYYLCGPPAFVQTLREELIKAKINSNMIITN